MIELLPSVEERLLQGYRAQLSRYDRAAEILATASSGQGRGSWDDHHWAHALHAQLQEAAALNSAMGQDIAAWREAGQTPTGPLQEILERLAQRIRTLSEGIDRQVGELQTDKLGLVAEIDEFIQKRRMLSAYVQRGS